MADRPPRGHDAPHAARGTHAQHHRHRPPPCACHTEPAPEATAPPLPPRLRHRPPPRPHHSGSIEQWPDLAWTRPDPDAPTGLHLDVSDAPWLDELPGLVAAVPDALTRTSGFATVGDAVLRFTGPLGPVPSGAVDSVTSDALQWLDLDDHVRIPYETFLEDEGRQLRLRPLHPLFPGHRHLIVATRTLTDADGDCIAPSPVEADLLAGGGDPALAPVADALARALPDAGLRADAVSAAVPFVTHRDHQPLLAAAAALPAPTGWRTRSCTPDGAGRTCALTYDALTADGRARTLDVTAWLPDGAGPWPTLVYGHGLDGWRGQGALLADRIVPEGYAVVAVDAMHHGTHPDGHDGGAAFLGLDLAALTFAPDALRESIDQAALDEAQLVRQIVADPDLSGDGAPDAADLGYVGMSLGGLLGSAVTTLSPDVDLAMFGMPGGHLAAFVTGFGAVDLSGLLVAMFGSDAALERALPVVQTAVDASDPALWASLLAAGREGGDPDLLMALVAEDAVVPPVCGLAVARAAGVAQLRPVITDMDGLEVVDAPLSGNHGGRTWGVLQMDRITSWLGTVVPAEHDTAPTSPEMTLLIQHFLDTWQDGAAEAIDPYTALGTPPL
ncbi:MAG: hypothetical protein R3F59_26970 [Myxococcota bacterium]